MHLISGGFFAFLLNISQVLFFSLADHLMPFVSLVTMNFLSPSHTSLA